MNRGMIKAKTPKQVSKSNGKSLAGAVAQIIGIGIVAGTALVLGTDKAMKKITDKEDKSKDSEVTDDVEE